MPLIKAGTQLPKNTILPMEQYSEAAAKTVNTLVGQVIPPNSKQYVPTPDAKGRQISRQGLFQAALQSVGVVQHSTGSFEDYLANVQKAAEAGLKWVNK